MSGNNKHVTHEHKKSKKRKYFASQQGRRNTISRQLVPGLRGFIVTCDSKTEKFCVREAYNLLNEYADKLYGPIQEQCGNKSDQDHSPSPHDTTVTATSVHNAGTSDADKVCNKEEKTAVSDDDDNTKDGDDDDDEEEEDIEKSLENELSSLRRMDRDKNVTVSRFHQISSNVKQCIFIKTTLDNPAELVSCLFSDISSQGTKKSRYIQRLLPVATTCKAHLDDMVKCAKVMLADYFDYKPKEGDAATTASDKDVAEPDIKRACTGETHERSSVSDKSEDESGQEGKGQQKKVVISEEKAAPETFGIVYKARNNNQMSRADVISSVADHMFMIRPGIKVCLTKPKYTITVDVLANVCCFSIVQDYDKYKKFNLNELHYGNKE